MTLDSEGAKPAPVKVEVDVRLDSLARGLCEIAEILRGQTEILRSCLRELDRIRVAIEPGPATHFVMSFSRPRAEKA